MSVTETRRIVLLGKTGAGKSSLANTIFGEDVFTVNDTLNSETKKCRAETRSVNGRSITLIDTPGFFDTDMSEEEMKPEIVKCITECAPGPHAFLIVIKYEKITKQEKDVFEKISQYFSEEAFKYATVVFTHGDQLPKGKKIDFDFVSQNERLSDLVKKCGGRFHVIDNKHWKNKQQDEYRSNQFQVAEILNTIDKTVKENNGGCYTNEMLQTVWKMINKHGKKCAYSCLKMLAGIGTGALLGALLGVTAVTDVIVKALMTKLAAAAADAAAGAAAGAGGGAAAGAAGGVTAPAVLGIAAGVVAAGAIVGGCVGAREAAQADTVGEAVERVFDKALQPFKNFQNSKKQQ